MCPASTEIYTDLHTLSRRDAYPCCRWTRDCAKAAHRAHRGESLGRSLAARQRQSARRVAPERRMSSRVWPSSKERDALIERSAGDLIRHPGLDPGFIFTCLTPRNKGGCRIKSGMTMRAA